MEPVIVSDADVLACRDYFPGGHMDNISGYRLHFSYALGRKLSLGETSEILRRINGFGPQLPGTTWADVERSTEAFWRGQLP